MRRILVDAARRRHSHKHGGGRTRLTLDAAPGSMPTSGADVLELAELLDQLTAVDPAAAQLVHLRFFAGLTGDQAAEVLGISPRSADHLWAYARAWLFEKLRDRS
jgi:RNA polymerase sigma factor (TIGR02999 family)